MANINYIPEVKTVSGFDIMNTVSMYTNHVATACTTSGDTYNISVIAPNEILIGKFVLIFTPDSNNIVNMKININSIGAKSIYVSDVLITAGLLKTSVPVQVLVDMTLNKVQVLGILQLLQDATPKLGGELDQNGKTIGGAEFDNGNSGTAKTIDWRLGNHQKVLMTGNCTFTFIAPTKPCMVSLRIINDATAGRTKTFPSIKYPYGVIPTWTTTANGIDILSLYFDGTAYYGQSSLAFA